MELLQHRTSHPSADVATDPRPDEALPVGAPIELRSRFDDRWTHGFSVATYRDRAYQVRRLSDGHVLPAWFPAEIIRPYGR